MRVAMFTTSYPQWPGDMAGHFVRSLACRLANDHAMDVTVFCPASASNTASESGGRLSVRRLCYFLPASWQKLTGGNGIPWNLRRSVRAWLNLPGFFVTFAAAMVGQRGRAEILHAHWGVLGALAILTRRFHRACVVLTVHGSDLRSAMAPIRWATAWAIGRAEAVIAVSPELADECRHARPGANVHFVPNGVELPKEGDLQALHACAPERPGRPHLVTVGRQVAERRHALLIRAFAEIRAEHPHATLTLVGDGPERETLEAVARECGVSNAVRFTGQVPTERVREYFLVGDLYVSPTTIESFGLSVAEAAACGLPVVTTRVGFPQRLVADGRTGRVVPPDNQVALTAAIRELLAAPEQLRAMGQRMRERLLEMGLTWKSCAARTRNVYRDALKRRGGGDD